MPSIEKDNCKIKQRKGKRIVLAGRKSECHNKNPKRPMGKFYGTAILEFLYASIYFISFPSARSSRSLCSLLFCPFFALRACSLSRTQLVHARPSRTQWQAVERGEGSVEGTTRYAYKMYFVNKVNAITNKLDFVPCFLYYVAGPCIFGLQTELEQLQLPRATVGKSLKCASGAPTSRVCCVCDA